MIAVGQEKSGNFERSCDNPDNYYQGKGLAEGSPFGWGVSSYYFVSQLQQVWKYLKQELVCVPLVFIA